MRMARRAERDEERLASCLLLPPISGNRLTSRNSHFIINSKRCHIHYSELISSAAESSMVVVRLAGFVLAHDAGSSHPGWLDWASDLLVAIFLNYGDMDDGPVELSHP